MARHFQAPPPDEICNAGGAVKRRCGAFTAQTLPAMALEQCTSKELGVDFFDRIGIPLNQNLARFKTMIRCVCYGTLISCGTLPGVIDLC